MHLCGKLLAVYITNNNEEQEEEGPTAQRSTFLSEMLSLVKRKQTRC